MTRRRRAGGRIPATGERVHSRVGRAARDLLAVALLAAACGGSCLGRDASTPETDGWIDVRGHRVAVEIADDAEEQARGLGGRDGLAWDRGMYFLYERPAFYRFWMKDMRFPIDIVWIRRGHIVDLDVNIPFDPNSNGPTVSPSSLVDAVLELPAGYVVTNGWQVGDAVAFEPAPGWEAPAAGGIAD